MTIEDAVTQIILLRASNKTLTERQQESLRVATDVLMDKMDELYGEESE